MTLGKVWEATRKDLLTAAGLLAVGGSVYYVSSAPAAVMAISNDSTRRDRRSLPGTVEPLTQAQVSSILLANERILHPPPSSKGILLAHQNYVPANAQPGEDATVECTLPLMTGEENTQTRPQGTLFAVFDGHSGAETSSALKEFLASYVDREIAKIPTASSSSESDRPSRITEALKTAFKEMDKDLLQGSIVPSSMALKESTATTSKSSWVPWALSGLWGSRTPTSEIMQRLRPALAGSCALVAFMEQDQLYVACTGDSRAVLAKRRPNGSLYAMDLSIDQTTKNTSEYSRLLDEHPGEESTVVKRGRVLGGLMPTRAFGDARYKWPSSTLGILSRFGLRKAPSDYKTPPYVTAEPVVTHVSLEPGTRDAFVILATDGLWDELSSEEAVATVESCDVSENSATSLITYALGGGDPTYLAHNLAIPPPLARKYRDDVTATVVFFGQASIPVPQGALPIQPVHSSKAGLSKDNLSSWLALLKARSGSKL